MKFELTAEQTGFAAALDDLLTASDTPAVIRAWAAGSAESGLTLWGRLAELGVNALLVPEAADGMGATQVDAVVAFEALGRHAVPGPWIESVAYLPTLLADSPKLLAELAGGQVATAAAAPHTPRALDADVADAVYVVAGGSVHSASAGAFHASVDPARRLFDVTSGSSLGVADRSAAAYDVAALAASATLLGLGERMLAISVDYVKARKQFGRAIGEYQALKHQLANVRVALDFTRPLVYGAALSLESNAIEAPRDVSAAKVHASESAYLAARTALQVHGAIGYTAEYDLGLWIGKTKALASAWGTPAAHRTRVMAALAEGVR